MLSVETTSDKATIIHENTGIRYDFPWDFSLAPNDFVHKIKEFLIPKHYPLLVQEIYEPHKLTPEELAEKVEQGTKVEDLKANELKLVKRKLWLIDRVIVWNNIFLLQEIDENRKPLSNYFRYKYDGIAITFMNDYRNGKFKSLEEAGKAFFEKAYLINEIVPKEKKNEKN